ncbi:glycoside hydrolase family 66 protein [Deinococcus roseus]|uniref:Cycloisomaltooligosaccharide glucanotransferase n=1 Tax=Deinococcus roseus TaxID=392414 RepID=A0ABQ2D8B0_9DEIO|nr:glycoside hydrolase family 66 protein [Deinococcus roseus]GGJ47412.1 cycloisomaltooligosaccharide glucanotransferase [Deinococcus roseus]
MKKTPLLSLLTFLLALPACNQISPLPVAGTIQKEAAGPLIKLINTNKARYLPGETVTLYVDLTNTTSSTFSGSVSLYFRSLGRSAGADQAQNISNLAPGASTTLTFTWTPPSTDFKGYLVESWVRNAAGNILDNGSVAVDVSSNWTKFPRYGYVSEFGSGLDAGNLMWRMKNYHINAVQFYDWQWQHHRPYSANSSWKEMANRDVLGSTVTALIDSGHSFNMLAMNYNLIGGGYDNYWSDGSGAQVGWGLFKNDHASTPADQDLHPLPAGWATQKLYQFNPANTNWQTYIFNEEKKVFNNFAFDGWHIDSLGDRGPLWTWDHQPVDLKSTFVPFINAAKTNLQKRMVFNNVATYGLDDTALSASVDVVYTELWDDSFSDDYADFNTIADRIRAKTSKGIVFPAYMNRDYCNSTPDGTTRFFNTPSILLTNAAIFASGATHLELGDGENLLCTEYFPNKKLQMSSELKNAQLDFYTFQTAYENLLMDGAQTSTLRTDVTGVPSSTTGAAGAVWKLRKQKTGFDILHLINFKNNLSSKWRDNTASYPVPTVLNNLPIKMYYSGSLASGKTLWVASPDRDHGKAYNVSYTQGADSGGKYVSFTVPSLKYWTMAYLER